MRAGVEASLRHLQASARTRLLFVGHSGGGGVGRHMDELARAIEQDADVLLLQPHSGSIVALRWLRGGEQLRLWFDAASEWTGLLEFLSAIGLERIHFHHVKDLPPEVLDLPAHLRCPHDLTLHDYFPVCPAYHLADADGRYCGMQPDCRKCLDAAPAQWGWTIAQWRERLGALLSTASRVIAPSRDAAERVRTFFPQVAALLLPNPETADPSPPKPLRILVPGAISTLKGLDVLRACVEDAALRGLPLHFVVLGFVGKPLSQWPDAPLTVTGEYPEGTLPQLIAKEPGDVFFFPSQCPETFSYTLSAALKTGLPIVGSGLGAIGERLRGRAGATTLPWDAPASLMNDALVAAAGAREAGAAASVPVTTFDAYREAYLAGLPTRHPRTPATAIEIADRWLVEPAAPPEQYPLAYLFQDGVVCGKARTLELLRRFVYDPDAVYAATDTRLKELIGTLWDERAHAARRLEESQSQAAREVATAAADAHEARERLREIEASTSWRMTAPLRRLVGLLRRKA